MDQKHQMVQIIYSVSIITMSGLLGVITSFWVEVGFIRFSSMSYSGVNRGNSSQKSNGNVRFSRIGSWKSQCFKIVRPSRCIMVLTIDLILLLNIIIPILR